MKLVLTLMMLLSACTSSIAATFYGGEFGPPVLGDVDVGKYSFVCENVDMTPAVPAIDKLKIYCKNISGTPTLYTLDGLGNELPLVPSVPSQYWSLSGSILAPANLNNFVGIENNDGLAPLHVTNTVGTTIATPPSLSSSLTLDTAINSPAGSASQVNGPDQPSGYSSSIYAYIDPVTDGGQFINQNTGSGGFVANGQTISYTIYAYRNVGGTRVVDPSALAMTGFTDSINDGTTTFYLSIGGWTTPNGYQDGFIVYRSDNTGNYWVDIGNNTSYTDNYFTNQDAYDTAQYASNGGNYNQNFYQYKNIAGSPYNSVVVTNSTYDGGIGGGTYVVFGSTWSATTNDGFEYETNNGTFYDVTTGTSFYDWGQTASAGTQYTQFSSVGFNYFDQSGISDGSLNAGNQNDGTGSYSATGTSYNYHIYEYKTNPITGIKYVTSGYAFILNDNGDLNAFTWGVDLNAGTGDGRIWINTDSNTGGDIGSGTHFDDDGAQPASPDISHVLGSYSGVARSFSAYGLVSSPSTKYSATPGTYSFTDNNPTQGYVIQHNLSTYGNATGVKDIESSYRGPAYDNLITGSTPSSYVQFNTSLGDDVLTPSTLGFHATGQSVIYHAYSKETFSGSTIFSSSAVSHTQVFPNDGQYYTVGLTIGAVAGTTYRLNKVGTGWQDSSSTSFQDDTSVGWSGSSTVTPTTIVTTPTAILDNSQASLASTVTPIAEFRNTDSGIQSAFNEFFYNNSGTETSLGRFGIASTGNFFTNPIGGGFELGTIGSPFFTVSGGGIQYGTYGSPATIINSGTGTIFNRQSANGYDSRVFMYAHSISSGILATFDPMCDSAIFGTTCNNIAGGNPSSRIAIEESGTGDKGLLFEVNSSNDHDLFATMRGGNGAWGVDNDGWMGVGVTPSSTAALVIKGSTSAATSLRINSGSLPTSPVSGNIEYDGTSFYGTTSTPTRLSFLQQFPSVTTAGDFITITAGGLIQETTHWKDTGTLLIGNLQIEAKNGISLDNSQTLSLGSGGSFLMSTSKASPFNVQYVAKTANYTLSATDVLVECTANSFTITLPTAVGVTGRMYIVKDSGSGTITFNTTSSQKIDTYASGLLTMTQGQSYTFISNNANWIIV